MTDKDSEYILPEHVSRTLGREAQRNNILAAKVIADIVKTTLGPRGMDKMLVNSSGEVIVTNDGVTILEEMEIDHPAAKMITDIAKTQESEVGDGTTTAALLAGTLLAEAEKLLERKIHPTVIAKGYRLAVGEALRILQILAIPVKSKEVLKQVVMTAMTGKGAEGNKEALSELIVQAVDQVAEKKEISLSDIKIQKLKGESVQDSTLIQGMIIDKERSHSEMPSLVSKARILILDCALELKSPESETKISISSPDQLNSFLESEENRLKEMADLLIASGASVIFCQKGIDDVLQYYLAKAGIFACRRVAKSDLEKIAKATGGKIISQLRDVHLSQLGSADEVEEVRKGEDFLVYIRGCSNPHAVTILLRGSTQHILDELERAVKDGLGDVIAAIKSGAVVAGGGAVEIELSKQLRVFARSLGGREQLAVDAFANSLECVPEALAENAGLDPIDILAELKRKHETGSATHGLNLFTNQIEDMLSAGIIEPLKVKTQAISSAAEVASMILRIDDVLISKGPDSNAKKINNPYRDID